MGLIERVAERKRLANQRRGERSWPVGVGSLAARETTWGHDDSRFSPEEYGDALATSNDVYSVVTRRARLMAGLQLRFYKGRGNDKKEITSHPAVDLHWRVNEFWHAERLARMDELCMGLWGETYWALQPGTRGEPGEIWWMKPSQVRPVVHENNYLQGFLYEPQRGGERIAFRPDEVLWFRYPNPVDEFSPMSPLAAAKLAAETSTAMMTSNRNLHRQGLQLAGLVVPSSDKVTFSPEQATELEEKLLKRFSGTERAHRWAVLRYEAQFRQLSITPKDAEFVTGLSMTFRQVCRAYGMQSVMLNDLENATLANAREFERVEWDGTLKPDAEFRAAEIREQYLPRFTSRGGPDYCEYDFSQVSALQESASESWGREAQALDRGLVTINEIRRRRGMPDVAWGDEPWLPMNKAQFIDGELGGPKDPEPPATPGAPVDPNAPAAGGQVPPAKLPDDEVNPANQPVTPKMLDHQAARRLLAQAFGDMKPLNGHALIGR